MPSGVFPHKPCSEETKKKIRDEHLGRVFKPEWRIQQIKGIYEARLRKLQNLIKIDKESIM